MSKVINNEGYKPGSIYRIALVNFVTYKEVVLFPGPSLNMIIGPNGTGKSTFVCAIILGLCGKTSAIGRAKKISDYVRTGCEDATIEIELYRKPGKRNVIITREFNLRDTSKWSIDKKAVSESQVKELIASLNIQVDNLCQLLPQDRVQDFSKMNPQELLRSTLSAVGGTESVQQLDELIETRNQQRGLTSKVANNVQLLEEQTKLNERLKLIIDTMKQRKEIEKQIQICEKKKLWLEYQELREKVIEYSNDKKKAVQLVNGHKSKMEPLEAVINKAKSGISNLEQQKLKANREIHSIKDKAKELLNSVRDHEFALKEIDATFQEKMERYKNKEQELIEAKAKLEKLITDKAAMDVRDEASIKMDLDKIMRTLSKSNAALNILKKQKLDIQYDLENNITPQIRYYQNSIRLLKDTHLKRLEVLRGYSEDTYKAVTWFRKNKQLFKHPVHEPMMLEINFTEPKFARYLESTVSSRDLVAFTFESSTDMNLFLTRVRQEQGLKRVNAICSQGGEFNANTANIQQLSYLGFYTYLVDTITAPDAIVRYLCKNYSIHRIPIGNEHTYNNSGRVPANITYFYTENHRFTVRVSAYSNAKSSSTTEIRPPRLLANTVDIEQLHNLNTQLANFENKAETHKTKINEIDNKISDVEDTVNEVNVQRKAINDSVEKVRTISAQIRIQTQKVRGIENEPTLNIQEEKIRCRQKQKAIALKQCNLHQQLCELLRGMKEKQMNGDIWKTHSVVFVYHKYKKINLFEFIEDQFENLESARRIPRNRVFKTRVNYFADLDDCDFFARFRLSKNAANCVHNLIKNKIRTKTPRNRAVPTEIRLLLTLRYLATGSYLRTAADFSGVSPPTASRIIKITTEAIALLSPEIIKFPENLSMLQEGFYNIARFPRVVAAIDCTHVTIKSPGGDTAETFRNRKSNFSINVKVACDSQLKCLNIVARWPGSVHDQTIFNNSALKQKFESVHMGNGLLLGDSGYESKKYLLTPILNPTTPAENLYNEAQIRTRNTIERCFGVCKNRFPVLRRQITLSLKRTQAIIVACFVLHNIAIDSNDANFGDHHDSDILPHEDAVAQTLRLDGDDARNRLIQQYFLPLLNCTM